MSGTNANSQSWTCFKCLGDNQGNGSRMSIAPHDIQRSSSASAQYVVPLAKRADLWVNAQRQTHSPIEATSSMIPDKIFLSQTISAKSVNTEPRNSCQEEHSKSASNFRESAELEQMHAKATPIAKVSYSENNHTKATALYTHATLNYNGRCEIPNTPSQHSSQSNILSSIGLPSQLCKDSTFDGTHDLWGIAEQALPERTRVTTVLCSVCRKQRILALETKERPTW
jgi:hypothetical protein